MGFLTAEQWLCVTALAAVLCMAAEYLRRKRKLRAVFLGAGSGIAALLLLHRYGAAVGFAPSLNALNFGIAAVGGIPALLLAALLFWIFPAFPLL